MKAGVVDDAGRSLSAVSLPTEAHLGQEHGLAQMCAAIRLAAAEAHRDMRDITAIGVATPGLMDIPAGVILDPPNLKPWHNVPVRQHIHDVFGIPTAFQNDANAAAFGEYWVGAGRGTNSLVLFTLGTGVGGGIIDNGRIIEGRHSHGAECGHIIIQMDNARQCTCGAYGHLEAYASATALVKRAVEALEQDRSRPSALRGLLAEHNLTARTIDLAAVSGDPLARQLMRETARYLAVGAVSLMHTFDPDIVLFGGGMIAAGESFLEDIRTDIRSMAFPVPAAKTRIAYAELGGEAGFIGAAGCARLSLQARHEP